MPKTVAVVAHFDPDDVLDPTLHGILEDLEALCDSVVLVTTSRLAPDDVPKSKKIQTICRPNIGYDFYSYRVGLSLIHI